MKFNQTDIYNTIHYAGLANKAVGGHLLDEVTISPFMGHETVVSYLNYSDRVNVVSCLLLLHEKDLGFTCDDFKKIIIGWHLPVYIIDCDELQQMIKECEECQLLEEEKFLLQQTKDK